MKIKDLINKKISLELEGIEEADFELEIEYLTIHISCESRKIKANILNETINCDERTKENLETLGYSFEVGV